MCGDIFATVNADGTLLSTFMTGTFGGVLPTQPQTTTTRNDTLSTPEPLQQQTPMQNPTNTADGTTYQYVGQHEKMTDTSTSPILGGVTQMGARVYISTLRRFLSIDPQEGGTDNNYAYENDPVNSFDLDGNAGFWSNIRKSVQKVARWTWKNRETILAVAGVAACVIGTALACGAVAVASAALSAGIAAKKNTVRVKISVKLQQQVQ